MNGEQAKWAERVARLGLVAKGVVYMVVGGLSALAAFGLGGRISGRNDAFQWIIGLPFGRFLLAIVALGLLAYVFWRSLLAIKDLEDKGSDAKGILRRIAIGGRAAVYITIAFYAGMLAWKGPGNGDNGDNGDTRQFIVATLLQQSYGQWLVGAVALFFIGSGIYQIHRSLSGRYKKRVKEWSMNKHERNTFLKLGRIGYFARGVVLGVIGVLFINAAVRSRASDAQGTEGAFQFLYNSGYGPWLMGSVALGLFAYGIFCLVLARYRTINTR